MIVLICSYHLVLVWWPWDKNLWRRRVLKPSEGGRFAREPAPRPDLERRGPILAAGYEERYLERFFVDGSFVEPALLAGGYQFTHATREEGSIGSFRRY